VNDVITQINPDGSNLSLSFLNEDERSFKMSKVLLQERVRILGDENKVLR